MKFHILRDPESLSEPKWKVKVFEKILDLLKDKQVKQCVKVKITELLATMIYKGHLYGLEHQSKESLSRIILDQLNQIDSLDEMTVDIADALSSNN